MVVEKNRVGPMARNLSSAILIFRIILSFPLVATGPARAFSVPLVDLEDPIQPPSPGYNGPDNLREGTPGACSCSRPQEIYTYLANQRTGKRPAWSYETSPFSLNLTTSIFDPLGIILLLMQHYLFFRCYANCLRTLIGDPLAYLLTLTSLGALHAVSIKEAGTASPVVYQFLPYPTLAYQVLNKIVALYAKYLKNIPTSSILYEGKYVYRFVAPVTVAYHTVTRAALLIMIGYLGGVSLGCYVACGVSFKAYLWNNIDCYFRMWGLNRLAIIFEG